MDYEDFLRQRKLTVLTPYDPILMRFKKLQCRTLEQVQAWVAQEHKLAMDNQGRTQSSEASGGSGSSQCLSLSSSCLAANAALSLLNVATYLLDRQVSRLAQDFENEGGFTERLYKVRKDKRCKGGVSE